MLIISYIMGKYYTLVIKKETRREKLETNFQILNVSQFMQTQVVRFLSMLTLAINKIIFNTIQTAMLPPT